MHNPSEHNFEFAGPASKQRGRIEHLWILGLSLVAIAGAYILDLSPEGAVNFTSDHFGFHLQLPETCMSRRISLGFRAPDAGSPEVLWPWPMEISEWPLTPI